jgi:hypothetical protein
MTRVFVFCLIAGFLVLVAPLATLASDGPADLIAQADKAYLTRYVEESMTLAITLYEAVLPNLGTLPVQSQAYVLNRLSQLCYEIAMFSEGDTAEDRASFNNGKDYGMQSLRLNPEFAANEPDGLQDALVYVTDTAALHWTANNWGKLCGMNPIQGLLQQKYVLALFSRCVELDPGFWGGSSANALGSLLIMSPGALGGDKEEGLALIEGSIVSDPSYLFNHIIYAEYWGFTYGYFGQLTGVRDAELIERELELVEAGSVDAWPFWNRQAKAQVDRLRAQLERMTR